MNYKGRSHNPLEEPDSYYGRLYPKDRGGIFSLYATKQLSIAENGLQSLTPLDIFGEDALGFNNIPNRINRYHFLKHYWQSKKQELEWCVFEDLVLDILAKNYQEAFMWDISADIKVMVLGTILKSQEDMSEFLGRPLETTDVYSTEKYIGTPLNYVHEVVKTFGFSENNPALKIPLVSYMENSYQQLFSQRPNYTLRKIEGLLISAPVFTR